MVNPPRPGDVSYKQFMYEKDSLLNSLKRRARLMTDAFNALEGVTCQETEGVYVCLSLYTSLFVNMYVYTDIVLYVRSY